MTMSTRCYSDLIKIPDFVGRFKYLQLKGQIGKDTFGFERYLNQVFYKSTEWKRIRDIVIVRDEARDLGIEGRELTSRIYIHHMNPITVSFETHQAIHYGDENLLMKDPVVRTKFDTCPWRQ